LLAGEYPGDPDPATAAARLHRFADAGITIFVDLTEPLELEPYAHLLRDDTRHERRPIPDLGTVSTDAYRETLDLVDGALTGGHAVYLHCLGGIGRTGTVVALWLVRHGLDGGDPISRLAELRRNVPAAWMPSPQTRAQRRVVQHWTRGG
jgi:protein-tyrosine phosphatase